MRGARILTLLLALLPLPASSVAQVQTMPVRVCEDPLRLAGAGGAALVDELTSLYYFGRREELRSHIEELVARIRAAYPQGCPAGVPGADAPAGVLDPARNHVAVSWVGSDPRSARSTFVRVVLHGTGGHLTLANTDDDLPGLGATEDGPRLVELFIARTRTGVMRTVCLSTRERDPASPQLAQFLQALSGPLVAAVGAIAGDVRGSEAQGDDLWATIALLALPHPRATIRMQVSARDGDSAYAEFTFRNRPLTRWSFGAGAAVIAAAAVSPPRVDLDSAGAMVADPLPRALTMAHVNWSPRGYDEDAPDVRLAERYRLFFGAALTPDFGIVAGVNVLLVRGVGIAGGVAFLFARGAHETDIGKAPADPASPFRLTVPAALFIGLTWNAK